MITPLTSGDEELHQPDQLDHWQESFYFNWITPDGIGFARLGYRAGDGSADAVVITMRAGRREFVYAAINQKVATTPSMGQGFRVGRLTFRMDEPLHKWHLELSGRDNFDLTWTALSPPFDFAESGGAHVLAARHFEHPGTVTGTAQFSGQRYSISGFGTRDKSWGPRDWSTIAGWDWISAHFGGHFAVTASQTGAPGSQTQSGFVYRDRRCVGIESFDLQRRWRSPHRVADLQLRIRDVHGEQYDITGAAIGDVALFKAGMLLSESHARFETHLDGQLLTGAGIVEHTWHAGGFEPIRWAPRLAPVLAHALRTRR
ncbi:hypothetical protein ORI20_08170 [Mycobacterium sp. CVI_P3]|uniref:Hydroxyneurosporene synthase (CrtC) n=1 Tax=Mycobacterium pinniadriaticum TaxID=2994102 RepID=A0ABT3SB03_9MYCO|nr:hypothetical protein [Mycobacterium pinniadriaticum]MCX2930247.1 hypothetical protein [Mycobacterium pinniadriaticum]MCX2936691.1 hypothetical protein [Mycobacterium pinniadriaticum]